MRPYVARVAGEIKNGVRPTNLSRKVLVLGRNGLGKSALVNAIELAGTGRVSDVAGRATVANAGDLALLCPPSGQAFADATLSDGSVARWALDQGHRAKRSGPEIAFPLRDVVSALLGSPETARKWLLLQMGDLSLDEVLGTVPVSLRARCQGALSEAVGQTSVDRLIWALESAKKAARQLASQAKALRSATPPSQPPPPESVLTGLERAIEAWHRRSSVSNRDGLLQAKRTESATFSSMVRALTEALAQLPQPETGLEIREAALLVIRTLIRAGSRECAICGAPISPELLGRRADVGAKRIEAATESGKEWLRTKSRLEEAERHLSATKRTLEVLEKDAASLPAEPDLSLEEAQRKLREAQTVRAAWDACRGAEERALLAEQAELEWAQLAEVLGSKISQLVTSRRDAFVARVQAYLPDSDQLSLDLGDGTRETFRLGLLRDGHLARALSGAEWARVTAALALATAPKSGPCVVVPEERAWDPQTLAEVLRAFDRSLGGDDSPQLIVTSPVPPSAIPEGWQVVTIDPEPKRESTPGTRVRRAARPVQAPAAADPVEDIFK